MTTAHPLANHQPPTTAPAIKVLVSVRNLHEAHIAASAGVHFIDLKEPAEGALGGLPPELIALVVATLREQAPTARISATIGDWPADALMPITARVRAVAATGVDYVKVGVPPGPAAPDLLRHLAMLQADGLPLVPVFLADQGVPPPKLLAQACAGHFPALMLDTQHKRSGSLLDLLPAEHLQQFVRSTQAAGIQAGLAGALRQGQWPQLQALAPDFAGFRSAVCEGDRAGTLRTSLVLALIGRSGVDRSAKGCRASEV